MRDAELLEKLERIQGLLGRSFVRYIADVASPFTEDDWDRRALEALASWSADTARSEEALNALLLEEKVHVAPPSWPIHFAQYNLIRPTHVLAMVMRDMDGHLAQLREEAAGLAQWPEEARLVTGMLEKEEEHLRAIEALERDRPKPPPKPGVKKGVSANFW